MTLLPQRARRLCDSPSCVALARIRLLFWSFLGDLMNVNFARNIKGNNAFFGRQVESLHNCALVVVDLCQNSLALQVYQRN